jgi:hypothetical protein
LVKFYVVFVYAILSLSTAAKNNLEAELKKLQGEAQSASEFLVNYDVHLAENKALRMAASAKENNDLIPRPAKGASKKGFKLQVAMGLEDNDELYGALRVRPTYNFLDFFSSARSALPEMLSRGLVLTTLSPGPDNPRI